MEDRTAPYSLLNFTCTFKTHFCRQGQEQSNQLFVHVRLRQVTGKESHKRKNLNP